MSDGITDSERCVDCRRINCFCDLSVKEFLEDSNIHDGCNQEIGDLKFVLDMRDDEIKELKSHIKFVEETNHELWEMNNILETSLKGYDKIITEYPYLKKENEKLKKKLETIEKEWENQKILRLEAEGELMELQERLGDE